MNILLVSNMYPSEKSPFLGGFVKNCGEILKNNQHHLDYCVINQVSRSTADKIKNYSKLYFLIFKQILIHRYDVIYVHYASHCYLPIYLAKKLRKNGRLIVHVHGGDVKYLNGTNKLFFQIKKFIINKALKKADKIIFPSKSYCQYIQEQYQISNNKCYLSYSGGVDTKKFSFVERDYQKPLRVLYAGRLIKSKNISLAIQVVSSFSTKELILDIIGQGTEGLALKRQVEKNNIKNVYFHPAMSQQELIKQYQNHDVLIYPSNSESLGLVPLEGMSTGMIPVLSHLDVFAEYIQHSINGYLCRTKQDYISCFELLLQMDKTKFNEMSHKARQSVVEEYTTIRASQLLLEAFK